MKNEQKILEILSRLDERLGAIVDKRVAKRQKPTAPRKQNKAKEIYQKVKADIQQKKFVVLSRYGKGSSWCRAKAMLEKDPEVSVLHENKITIVMLRYGSPIRKQGKIIVLRQKKPRHSGERLRIEKCREFLESGKSLTGKKIQKLCGCSNGTARRTILAFKNMAGYAIEKGQGKTSRVTLTKKAFQAPHEPPMRRKSEYTTFIANTLRTLRSAGVNNVDAWKIATERWNNYKADRKAESTRTATAGKAPLSPFPAFQSVKPEYLPILVGVLEKLAKKGVPLDYRSVAYALDINTESEYRALIEEIITKWGQINQYFGVNTSLKWDGKSLRLN